VIKVEGIDYVGKVLKFIDGGEVGTSREEIIKSRL